MRRASVSVLDCHIPMGAVNKNITNSRSHRDDRTMRVSRSGIVASSVLKEYRYLSSMVMIV